MTINDRFDHLPTLLTFMNANKRLTVLDSCSCFLKKDAKVDKDARKAEIQIEKKARAAAIASAAAAAIADSNEQRSQSIDSNGNSISDDDEDTRCTMVRIKRSSSTRKNSDSGIAHKKLNRQSMNYLIKETKPENEQIIKLEKASLNNSNQIAKNYHRLAMTTNNKDQFLPDVIVQRSSTPNDDRPIFDMKINK
jgi:hypothetical protein